ncbi:MAG: pyrimidine-nucleoside phosphorylase [Defluviitaleaceae bacterium]|nr:pyrimidine-nucleoside phosphorylase [Defluviitaleaceae bacterium]
MRIYDIIQSKKRGDALSNEEIQYIVRGVTDGTLPDYQTTALLMAICLKGMNAEETTALTLAMAASGDQMDLSALPGVKVDKHSTGGVGDKTTLIVAPIVAALGVTVAKMSGRGLGHTGGTVDKLEGIPGFRAALGMDEFFATVHKTGICVAGQSMSLAPADKKIYALRDATATVDSIPLIAASIMSKKLAAGADRILLDVKTGNGAFMKTTDEARALAGAMVAIGNMAGRRTSALITDMSAPLGTAIGNILEVKESIEVLSGGGSDDLRHVSIELAAHMVQLAHIADGDIDACRALALEAITNGQALEKFAQMVAAQGGDRACIDRPDRFPNAQIEHVIPSPQTGYITAMDTEGIGIAAMLAGAGRETAEDEIDYTAGLILHAKIGDYIKKGQPLATLHTATEAKATAATERLLASYTIADNPVPKPPLIHEYITG